MSMVAGLFDSVAYALRRLFEGGDARRGTGAAAEAVVITYFSCVAIGAIPCISLVAIQGRSAFTAGDKVGNMRSWFRLLTIAFWLLLSGAAHAACPGTSLTNGTIADANDVMAWLNCKAPLDSPHFMGNVGIGTTNPGVPLSVVGPNASPGTGNEGLRIQSASSLITGSNLLQFGTNSTNNYSWIRAVNNGIGESNLTLQPAGGNIGIGTTSPSQKLEVAGTIRQSGCITAGTLSVNSSGDIICSSDARLKNVHAPYHAGLKAISRIDPVLFSYRPTENDPHESFVHAGFLAQNVKAVIPQASALQRDGYYSLDTTAILAAAVNAIKELKKQNDAQAAHIQRQDAAITELKGRVDAVERRTEARTAANYH